MAEEKKRAATLYELRIRFNSPADLGRAVDAAAPAILDAEIPMRPTVDAVALEGYDGESFLEREVRELTDIEEAAAEAGTEQGDTPFGGTLEIVDEDNEDVEEDRG
jgi:hypothetical protein